MKISVKSVGYVDVSGLTSLHIKQDQTEAAFSDKRFDSLIVEGSNLTRCTFTRIESPQACFGAGTKMSVFEDCTFERCKLTLTVAGRARLVRCKFFGCQLMDVIAPSLELVDCQFEETTIRGAAFHGTVPADIAPSLGRSRNDFYGNDFSNATLHDVGFNSGISLAAQSLPVGPNYLYIGDTKAAAEWLKKTSLPSPPKEAKVQKGLMLMMSYYVSTGQKDQLLTAPFPEGLREAAASFGSIEA